MINAALREILDDATDMWGPKVIRVEIQRIEPPPDVTDAMHRQMKAERDRRALVTEAEGDKRSRILQAEGVRESAILEAEGRAEAIRKVADAQAYEKEIVAEGEGKAVERVFRAIHEGDRHRTSSPSSTSKLWPRSPMARPARSSFPSSPPASSAAWAPWRNCSGRTATDRASSASARSRPGRLREPSHLPPKEPPNLTWHRVSS